ncbi:copper chaperone PCu(A)C [Roseobacter sp. YSTF-M11]|uniref:Copper chaperone PCu(A)C n=1 Tax=Roseobacter insulae TaxID=2859783 RepID=A0A9X1FTH1_9RHOB|nr:copper chaperone PCu(A)C [Roseobacter insulae]MBW4707510.1 copper chaperone PCu(A)C [Roseobacter insulae]
MKGLRVTGILLLIFAAGWAVIAREDPASDILIGQAVMRPLDDRQLGAFLSIDNRGDPDRLLAVSSASGRATLYNPAADGGLPVQTGVSSLALDGAHIRLGITPGILSDGALVPLTLTFEHAGPVVVKARLSDPATPGQAADVGLFGVGDICIVGEGEPAPRINLTVEPDGQGWKVLVTAVDFTFSEDLVGLYHVPGTGHGHIYVGGMKLGRLYAPQAHVGALPKGTHEIRVTLNTNDHRAYVVDEDPVTASAMIVVD